MGDLSDRREARRFVMALPVRVLAHDANSPELKAHTRDVSYRGLYFLSEGRFENGSEIDFNPLSFDVAKFVNDTFLQGRVLTLDRTVTR